MEQIEVYTDGSSRGNPGPGGWGVVIVNPSNPEMEALSFGGREKHTTNNRMELLAPIEAIRYASAHYPQARVIMHLDSAYVLGGVTSWIVNWEKNGWKTVNKKDVLNKDLWVSLIAEIRNFKGTLEWKKVSGHSGVKYNEEADRVATMYADGDYVR